MPRFTAENNYVSVSADFIKNKLPSANPTFVKVYIYILMLAREGESAEFSEIADCLGLLESDFVQALKYWENQGELIFGDDAITFTSGAKIAHEQSAQPTDLHHVDGLADIISRDGSLSEMFMYAQQIMGKTITEKEMETIYWFYSDLGMSVEVILMLLEYCVSRGKNRMSYIEKVAVAWSEMGLKSADKVEAYMKEEDKKTGFLYSIRKVMGIADRSLSQMEEDYLTKWHDEYGMSEEMIALSYEYCIIQTAKLSFPYMDKILTRWHDEGIDTIPAAEEDNKRFRSRANKQETAFSQIGFDSDELEQLSRK